MTRRTCLIVSAMLLATIACKDEYEASTANEVIRQTAAAYAKAFRVTPDEAGRRLRVRAQQDQAIERLRTADRGRFAGLWIEHQPQFRIVVRLKGTAPAGQDLAERARSMSIPVTFVTGATATEDEVLTKASVSLGTFRAAFPSLDGIDYDVKTGEIVLYVYAAGAAAMLARDKGKDLTKAVENPIRVEVLPVPLRDQDVRGGAPIPECTSAFVVQDRFSNRGVVTAAHCDNTLRYEGYDGTNTPMTFQAELLNANHDLQWHTTPLQEIPEFYADQTSSTRVLTGQRLRSRTAAGDLVCHRGRVSGYSCGNVESTVFWPMYPGACGSDTCDHVWVSVTGASLACAHGDSGGPWFDGQTALGVHKGGDSIDEAPGHCKVAFYTSTDYLSELGLSLVFGR